MWGEWPNRKEMIPANFEWAQKSRKRAAKAISIHQTKENRTMSEFDSVHTIYLPGQATSPTRNK